MHGGVPKRTCSRAHVAWVGAPELWNAERRFMTSQPYSSVSELARGSESDRRRASRQFEALQRDRPGNGVRRRIVARESRFRRVRLWVMQRSSADGRGQVRRSDAVGQETEIANLHEPRRQDV
jgi:hypothetical protein